MSRSSENTGTGGWLLRGVLSAAPAMALFWLLETLGFAVRGQMAGTGFQTVADYPSGPSITLLLYLGLGLLPGAVYYGWRWRGLWQGRAGRLITVLWAALGLHLFLRLSMVLGFHPGLSVHTLAGAVIPPALFFVLSGELARGMALWGARLAGKRPDGPALQRALLFFLHGLLYIGMTLPVTLNFPRLSAAGLGLLAGSSIVVGGMALFGYQRDARSGRPRTWIALALGLLVIQLTAEGFTGWGERTPAIRTPAALSGDDPRGVPIIQITVDTLRADRMSQYGGPRDTSPLLDALEKEGAVRFVDCTSQAPWTVPSTSSMFTGRHPCRLGTLTGRLKESEVTLAERLGSAGYVTAAFSDNSLVTPVNGFRQGFDEFHFYGKHGRMSQYSLVRGNRNLDVLLDRVFHQSYGGVDRLLPPVLAWLEMNRERTFYLYLHLMDPHGPYYDHPGFRPAEGGARAHRPVTITVPALYAQKEATGAVEAGAEHRHELLTRYDAEISHTDQALARLFEKLRELGLWSRSLLVLTSDHGEEFFEHGSWGHLHSVHRELLHVPLWIKPPESVPAGIRVVREPVQILDLVPTILDAAGVPGDGEELAGKSLWPLIRGLAAEEDGSARVITAATLYAYPTPSGHLSARLGDLKCVRIRRESRVTESWYDLTADPGELHPLPHAPRGDRAEAIVDALDRLTQSLVENTSGSGRDIQAQLRAIGYLQ